MRPICSTMRVRSLRIATRRRSTTSMRERQSASAALASGSVILYLQQPQALARGRFQQPPPRADAWGCLESMPQFAHEGFQLDFQRLISGVLLYEPHDGGPDCDRFRLAADLGYVL